MMLLCFQVTTSKKQLFFMFILVLAEVLTESWQSLDPLLLLHRHRVTELCVLGGPGHPGAFVELPAMLGMPGEQLLFCLGFSLPGNPRHVVSTAEG